MDDRKFDTGFERDDRENFEFKPKEPNIEVNPYFVSSQEESEAPKTESVNEPVDENNQYDVFYRQPESEYSQPVFRESIKKEKKKMSTNKKIVLASVLGGLGGCILAVVLVGVLLVNGTIGSLFGGKVSLGSSKIYVSDLPVATVNDGTEITIPDIIDAVGPAVVGINCQTQYTDWFWGTSVQPSSGSGVIINEDGYVVTNNHVIDGADEIKITLITGETYEMELVGSDARTDLAVIKVKNPDKKLPFATIGDSSKLRVGDTVIAIGNPLGEEFAGSATKGIVSATNRTVNLSDKTLTVIQTDAAINPGNSGGALVNTNGEVVGINTAKIANSSVEGLGFSIPSNEFLPVIEDLMANGHVTGRPLIGITGRAITEELSKQYGYPVGVYVVEVAPFSGAEDAGIRNKDVITEVEGEKVESIEDINEIRDKFKAGDKVKMKIYRKATDKTLDVEVTLGEDKGEAY